jgi:hypothetical protein
MMKNSQVLLLFITLVFPTFGQKGSVLDPSLKWNIGLECFDDGPIHPYDIWKTSFLHTEGDTLMNEKHYKKLISCADSLCGKKSLKSYIREEAGQVFLASKTEDFLQFDFNLQKGDTMVMQLFKRNNLDVKYYIRIDSVKTLLWPDQKVRLAQYVTVSYNYIISSPGADSMNDIFVEGIGSLKFGLEYPFNLFITGSTQCIPTLLCCHSGSTLLYSEPTINSCYLSTGFQQFQQPKLVQISANKPGMLELQLTEGKAGKLFVFDPNGKLILWQSVNHSGTQFCLPATGVYLFRFVSDEGKVQTGKICVN